MIIETEEQISRDDLREMMTQSHYDIATTDRKLRELTHEGIILPVYRDNYIIGYRFVEPKKELPATAKQDGLFVRTVRRIID